MDVHKLQTGCQDFRSFMAETGEELFWFQNKYCYHCKNCEKQQIDQIFWLYDFRDLGPDP